MAELQKIANRAARVHVDDPDGLLKLAAVGDELLALLNGSSASEVTDALAEALNGMAPSEVIPATASAERLLELMKERLEPGEGGPVLLDWIAVTGTSLLCARSRLEPLYPHRAVVLAAAAGVEDRLDGLELIVAARQLASR